MWAGHIYVEHCAVFGLAPSGGIQGTVADALLDVLVASGITPALKWVDDFVFFHFPLPNSPPANPHFQFDLKSILSISEPLGIPWHPVSVKGQDFGSLVTYVGFTWDLAQRTVSLPDSKRLKALRKVECLLAVPLLAVSCKAISSVLGTLQHISFIYRDCRHTLSSMCAFVSKFPHAFARHHMPNTVLDSLHWWRDILSKSAIPRSLLHCQCLDLDIWVDASTSFGVGLIVRDCWATWSLNPGWKSHGRDIGWAETIALELAVLYICASGYSDAEVVIHGDNKAVIDSFAKGRSRNEHRNHAIRHIATCIIPCNLTILPVYIPSATNRADPFSRGLLGPAGSCLPYSFALPPELVPVLSFA
jgi:hypothetical protein